LKGAGGRYAMRQWNLPPAVMANEQLYLAIAIPMLFNAALMAILFAYLKAKFDSLERRLEHKTLEQR
jgi:hypothetical protein